MTWPARGVVRGSVECYFKVEGVVKLLYIVADYFFSSIR